MFNAILIAIRFIILVFNGQKQVALENAALRQIQARGQAPQTALPRPTVLDRAEDDLEGLEIRTDDRSA